MASRSASAIPLEHDEMGVDIDVSTSSPPLNPIPTFDRTDVAYSSKSTPELLRAALSFSLCKVPPLVRHSEFLLQLTRRILGNTITDALLKTTLYGHFCAGEDEERIQPVIHAMQQAGVGSILDFAAEGDPAQDENASQKMRSRASNNNNNKSKEEELAELVLRENDPKARVYEYTTEQECDKHVTTFQNCIHDVANLQKDGYAAMKVTALVDTKLLARLSRVILEIQNLFVKFDQDADGVVSRQEFEKGIHAYFHNPDKLLQQLYARQQNVDLSLSLLSSSSSNNGNVDYVSWSLLLRPQDLPQILQNCRNNAGPLSRIALDQHELAQLQRLYDRMHAVARTAAQTQTRLLVDAEQALYQPAIDSIVLDLQREYNQKREQQDFPIVYNTYQCYLKDSESRLRTDMERSERLGYHFGAKLVRGAYMESERALAQTLGYESPIHDTLEDTHRCYNNSVRFLLEQAQKRQQRHRSSSNKKNKKTTVVEVMLASHNQDSIQQAVAVMNELGIDRRQQESTICFAQLYGMMDHVTYALGQHGYRAYKYVPYGQVQLAMPYLVRRAKENSSISGGAGQELRLLAKELGRRMFG